MDVPDWMRGRQLGHGDVWSCFVGDQGVLRRLLPVVTRGELRQVSVVVSLHFVVEHLALAGRAANGEKNIFYRREKIFLKNKWKLNIFEETWNIFKRSHIFEICVCIGRVAAIRRPHVNKVPGDADTYLWCIRQCLPTWLQKYDAGQCTWQLGGSSALVWRIITEKKWPQFYCK